jgi:hypothetical protein
MEMEPSDRMEIMIKVDFFHGEMCKKNLPKAKQAEQTDR